MSFASFCSLVKYLPARLEAYPREGIKVPYSSRLSIVILNVVIVCAVMVSVQPVLAIPANIILGYKYLPDPNPPNYSVSFCQDSLTMSATDGDFRRYSAHRRHRRVHIRRRPRPRLHPQRHRLLRPGQKEGRVALNQESEDLVIS